MSSPVNKVADAVGLRGAEGDETTEGLWGYTHAKRLHASAVGTLGKRLGALDFAFLACEAAMARLRVALSRRRSRRSAADRDAATVCIHASPP